MRTWTIGRLVLGVPLTRQVDGVGWSLATKGCAMERSDRGWWIVFGALYGAALGAVAGGSVFLYVEVTGEDWPQGLPAFVTGAIMGGFAGLVVGGLLGWSRGRFR